MQPSDLVPDSCAGPAGVIEYKRKKSIPLYHEQCYMYIYMYNNTMYMYMYIVCHEFGGAHRMLLPHFCFSLILLVSVLFFMNICKQIIII